MPRKAYLQHLDQLSKASPHPYVTGIRRGDDDGSFIFTYSPPSSYGPMIELGGVIPELSDYPDTHQIYLFTTSTSVPTHLTSIIETIPKDGVPIPQLIESLASTLSRACKVSQGNYISDSEDDDMDYDDELDGGSADWSDDEAEPSEMNEFSQVSGLGKTGVRKPELASTLRRDLRSTIAAGFRAGVLGDYEGGMDLYVSVSIRISKLGISDEAMSAWGLEKSKYLALLIHFNDYYQPFGSVLKDPYRGRCSVQFAVVTCKKYKPTLQQARNTFTSIDEGSRNHRTGWRNKQGVPDDECIGTFISRPLNELLNSRLIQLLLYRTKFGLSWDGAEAYFLDHQGTQRGDNDAIDEKYYVEEAVKTNLSSIVTSDSLSTGTGIHLNSFPLLAMQFMLRHFVRCTEFCLVCHKKVTTDFEAIKPYVCSTPLCLYQYMALGFGPSMDYEIKNEPTVVDLLISFCYVSAREGQLNDFPTGMNLLVPNTNSYQAKFHMEKRELHFPDTSPEDFSCPVKAGDWIIITVEDDRTPKKYHCRVNAVDRYPVVTLFALLDMDDLQVVSNPANAPNIVKSKKDKNKDDDGLQDVTFTIYNASFDELDDCSKRNTIVELLDTLPSVPKMQMWLQTSTSIANWRERISPAALGVLRWILASNRSCIMPVDGIKEQKVWGMHDWLQFRFAMGAPDKEQRFVSAVQDATKRMNLTYPSLFAFHGSALKNWHSIIREGLHFKETVHGRAFGHGCYHSLYLSTSLGYSSATSGTLWPHSTLNITQAICLNEIVNSPAEFVSRSPHLVVAQLDWIQTRYLFVNKKAPVHGQAPSAPSASMPTAVFQQDPSMTPRNGQNQPLIIPAGASSYRTRTTNGNGHRSSPTARASISSVSSADAEVSSEDEDDRIFLLYDAKKPTVQITKTDFRPATLDISGIQLLTPPGYASTAATKRLQGELKNILKLQEKHPIHELGWYINPDLVENVYQWIIEFHSFDPALPLAKDMKEKGISSIVMEARFGCNFPMTPPFIRVVKPRFLDFSYGGGGNVTAGGAMCMELLTNSGWSAVSSLESVFLQVRMALTNTEGRFARLKPGPVTSYSVGEAKEAYLRACRSHGWQVPPDFQDL